MSRLDPTRLKKKLTIQIPSSDDFSLMTPEGAITPPEDGKKSLRTPLTPLTPVVTPRMPLTPPPMSISSFESDEKKAITPVEFPVIVMFTSASYEGYGDFLFALKVLASLQKALATKFSGKIYLVTQDHGKEKILRLKGDEEFGVTVLSVTEYLVLTQRPGFVLKYYLEGPVFDKEGRQELNIPLGTPVLLLPEYSIEDNVVKAKDELSHHLRWHLDVIASGFDSKSQHGILSTPELLQVAESRLAGDFSFRKKYWASLDAKLVKIIRRGKKIKKYHETTELSFQYSHDDPNEKTYHSNNCQHFLLMLLAFTDKSKSQDVITVGKNKKSKLQALRAILPELKKNKFTEVIWINLQSGKKNTIYRKKLVKNPKEFRLIYNAVLPHAEVIKILALSGIITGVTGDQSFSEALWKLIVYECRPHKEDFAKDFISTFAEFTGSQEVGSLAEFLIYGPDGYTDLDKSPLIRAEIVTQYLHGAVKLARNYNLINKIIENVVSVVERTHPNFLFIDAISKMNMPRFEYLLTQYSLDSTALNLLMYACRQKNFLAAERIIKLCKESSIDMDRMEINTVNLLITYSISGPKSISAFIIVELFRSFIKDIIKKSNEECNSLIPGYYINALKRIKYTFHHYNTETLDQIKIGSMLAVFILLLGKIRNSKSSKFKNSLVTTIEKMISSLKMNITKKEVQNAFLQLKQFIFHDAYLLMIDEFIRDFNQYSESKISLMSRTDSLKDVIFRPLELKPKHIWAYQRLLASHQEEKNSAVLKISRKSPEMFQLGLIFSILQYANDKGFYIIDHQVNSQSTILGKGSWGTVRLGYYCRDGKITPQSVAIKKIDGESKKLLKETGLFAKVYPMKELDYLYRAGTRRDQQKSYAIFPRLPGVSLDRFLAENPSLTWQERLEISKAVAKALALVHYNKIVHLDVKAKNILYDATTQQARLIDFGNSVEFGQAKFVDLDLGEDHPPELFTGVNNADSSLDIYFCAPLIAHIMDISLISLLSNKLKTAVKEIKDLAIQGKIYNTFRDCSYRKVYGEGLFELPSECSDDPEFFRFLYTFAMVNQYNFDEMDALYKTETEGVQQLKRLLSQMTDEPKKRPSAYQIYEALTRIAALSSMPAKTTLMHQLAAGAIHC